jgi:hypothetical protein
VTFFPSLAWESTFMKSFLIGFEVFTAASTKMAVFWVVAPCSLVEVHQRFGGTFCLHHQGAYRPALSQ